MTISRSNIGEQVMTKKTKKTKKAKSAGEKYIAKKERQIKHKKNKSNHLVGRTILREKYKDDNAPLSEASKRDIKKHKKLRDQVDKLEKSYRPGYADGGLVSKTKYRAPQYTKGKHCAGKIKNSYACGGKVKHPKRK
jgi:hypothetical protein